MSDPVEEARRLEVINSPTERYEIWWSPRVSSRVLIPIDVAEAIRAEAVREWETAVREAAVAACQAERVYQEDFGWGEDHYTHGEMFAVCEHERCSHLRALLPEPTAPQEGRAG